MAATAYASVVSLLNTLDQIHTHRLVSTFFDINQTKSLSQKVNFFVDFVENYSDADSREVEYLVRRIADAAHEAENIVEVHAADRIRGGESPSFLHNLQKIMGKMESMKEEVIKVKEEIEKSWSSLLDLPPSKSSSSSSSSLAVPPATAEATTVVGFENYKRKLLDDLTGHDVARQIITITGMGGIGKTTLARYLYENTLVVRRFNVRVWVTVSQESSARKIFLQALSCLEGDSTDMDKVDDQQLSLRLHKILYNRRYLIILDDVWSVEIWNKIKFYFPENKNGSRIVVTTRESKLVDYIGSSALALKFLNEETSWKLFCEKTFSKQGFPPELKEVGKKIVKKCGGLPLAISVIGGFLGKLPRTHDHWEKIAKDKNLILNRGENSPSSILYLSYKYLPVCLKPCFLHFGLFPEDFEIQVSTLIKIWIAEGFIKANRGQSLEEVAESYFNDLVDRNLVLLLPYSHSRWNKCSTHDLIRDLCLDIGKKENFFCVQRSIDGNCHIIADQTTARRFYPKKSLASKTPSILHPLIVPGKIERAVQFKTRLFRVLYCDYWNGDNAFLEVNMRFLQDHHYRNHDYLHSSLLSRFWSLQTLIVSDWKQVVALTEIWKMPLLKHIDIPEISHPDPPPHNDDGIYVLENLQTLMSVKNLIFTEEVCKRIPNIKELHMRYDFSPQSPSYHLENVGCFNKLESLYFSSYDVEYAGDSLQSIKFPSSLKELKLLGCELEWSYMAVIASLPHLEILYLDHHSVAGTEWVFVDESFDSLKRLQIEGRPLTKWIVESSNFPVLENLSIGHFRELDSIPSAVGEIPTLQSIHLNECSERFNVSAVEMLNYQQSLGNVGLRVTIRHNNRSNEAALFRKSIQQLGLRCKNLVIKCESYLISPD